MSLLDQLEAGPWPTLVRELKQRIKGREMEDFKDGIIEGWVMMGGSVFGALYYDSKGRFDDGTMINTSTIVSFDTPELVQGSVITTRNSTYVLGLEAGDEIDD